MATVRYIVRDVDAAVAFYCDRLGFVVDQQFGPAMAILRRDDLSLWLAGPQASASRPMPDGRTPEPGGWARIVLEVGDIEQTATALRQIKCPFRSDIIAGPGGRQCLIEDPSGNAVELFEPRR